MNSLAKLLEAALFAALRPVPVEALASLDAEASPAAVSAALDELRDFPAPWARVLLAIAHGSDRGRDDPPGRPSRG